MNDTLEKEECARSQAFSRRLVVAGLVQAAGFGLIGGRLFQLQVTDQERYRLQADSNRLVTQPLVPGRGRILDRNGGVLAAGEEAFRAVFVPSFAADPAAVLELFARIVPASQDEIARLMLRVRRQRPNEPIVLANALSFDEVAQINLLAPRLPGVETEPAPRRRYPTGRLTGHVVGYIGHVSDVAVDDDPVLSLPWMRNGRSGLERGMDVRLRGRSGRLRLEVDARGHIVQVVDRVEPVAGSDVVTTLDGALQERVLDRLAGTRRAAAVVMDVHTGEIVAMASIPSWDPGSIVEGLSGEAWSRLANAPDDPLVNRAISGLYPPGSTFKMVTALAALEAGTVRPHESIRCAGHFTLAGHRFRCWKRSGHGPRDMLGALRESCDVYFYELARRTGIDAIAAMARRLGFGQIFECGLDLQKPGVVPGPDWKVGRFGRGWVAGETILAGIGQGYVLANPLQLAVMAARIATGKAVSPTLVAGARNKQDRDRAGELAGAIDLQSAMPATNSPPDLSISAQALSVVRQGMLACVNDAGGTGWRAQFEDASVKIAGKTGTSQISRASSRRRHAALRWAERDHALFVAYAPAHSPRYAVATVIEHGGSGGTTAAPIARDILAAALERDPAARPVFSPRATGGMNAREPGQTGRTDKGEAG